MLSTIFDTYPTTVRLVAGACSICMSVRSGEMVDVGPADLVCLVCAERIRGALVEHEHLLEKPKAAGVFKR